MPVANAGAVGVPSRGAGRMLGRAMLIASCRLVARHLDRRCLAAEEGSRVDLSEKPVRQRSEPFLERCSVDRCDLRQVDHRVRLRYAEIGWDRHVAR